jgi:hypothetical protein
MLKGLVVILTASLLLSCSTKPKTKPDDSSFKLTSSNNYVIECAVLEKTHRQVIGHYLTNSSNGAKTLEEMQDEVDVYTVKATIHNYSDKSCTIMNEPSSFKLSSYSNYSTEVELYLYRSFVAPSTQLGPLESYSKTIYVYKLINAADTIISIGTTIKEIIPKDNEVTIWSEDLNLGEFN